MFNFRSLDIRAVSWTYAPDSRPEEVQKKLKTMLAAGQTLIRQWAHEMPSTRFHSGLCMSQPQFVRERFTPNLVDKEIQWTSEVQLKSPLRVNCSQGLGIMDVISYSHPPPQNATSNVQVVFLLSLDTFPHLFFKPQHLLFPAPPPFVPFLYFQVAVSLIPKSLFPSS